ncbi:MAG: helix-turn-helix domain-containing protein [Methylovulum sp.]
MSRKSFDNETLKIIGARIRNIRGDLNQQQFADLLGVGRASIANYEAGRRLPNDKLLKKIASLGKTDVNFILRSGEPDNLISAELDEINKQIKKQWQACQELKVIPASAISNDEMAIIRILRSLPQQNVVEILEKILQIFDENYEVSGDHFTIQYAKEIKAMIEKGRFINGIDIEQLAWGIEQLEKNLQLQSKDPK